MKQIRDAIFRALIFLRVPLLLLVAGITVYTGLQIPNMRVDNSTESFFRSTDPTKVLYDKFRETFGNSDMILVLVKVDDAFQADVLYQLADLVEAVETQTPYVRTTTWLGNAEKIEGVEDGILIDQLLPDEPYENLDLEKIAQETLADPAYVDNIVTTDRQYVGIFLDFELYPEDVSDPRKEITPALYDILDAFPDMNIHIAGGPVVDHDLNTETANQAPLWFGLAVLGMLLALLFTTRNVAGVFVPGATVIISVIWTLGFMHLMGFALSIVAGMVPVVLLCVGIGDTMHVVAELRQNLADGMKRNEAIVHTLSLVSAPIFLTTLTTSAGFLAFLATDLQPLREIGIQTAMGVWIAFLLTYIFAVPILAFGKQDVDVVLRRVTEDDIFARLLAGMANFSMRYPVVILVGFTISGAASIYGITQLRIETNTIQELPESHPVRVSYKLVDDTLGGAMSMEIIVDSGKPDGIKDMAFMQQMEDLQSYLQGHSMVQRTLSIVDQLKETNRALHNNDPAYYRLPISSNQVAEYLLLYESGGGGKLEQYVSFTYDVARIQVHTNTLTLTQTEILEADIDAYLTKSGSNLNVQPTGVITMFARLGELIAKGQAESSAFALVVVSIIMMVMLRSVPLGLIAMIPNVLPVFFALGAMGLYSGKFSTIGVVIAPMILGVAVDDTVHFFVRYKRYFDKLGSYDRAYKETMRTVGRPLLFTTIVLLSGFAGFSIALFESVRMFAWAIYVAFLTALLADFLLAAVLLKWIRPLGPSVEERAATAAAKEAAAQESRN